MTRDEYIAQASNPRPAPASIAEMAARAAASVKGLRFVPTKDGGDLILNFGKHRGKTLSEVLTHDPSYGTWLRAQDWVTDLVKNKIEWLMATK